MTVRTPGQSGMTLLETLLAVALSALLALPIMGWALLSTRQQAETVERNAAGTSLGLLRASFVQDVTSARLAHTEGDALDGCGTKRFGGPALVTLVTDRSLIAYGVGPGDGGSASLWRIRCDADGAPTDLTELVTGVVAPATVATCAMPVSAMPVSATPGRASGRAPAGACRRVELRVTTADLRQTVLTASVRTGEAVSGELEVPTAVLTAEPRRGTRPLKVALSAAGSSDPAGGRLRYEWNLGDGATAEGQDVVHVFTRPGTHTVTLVVTNDAGATATATADLVVLGNAPVAVIAAPSSDVVVARGQPVVFSSKGSHDDADAEWGGRITGYEWDFGDGTRSTEPNPTKTYPTLSPGQGFVVTLTVVDDDGLRASATRRVVVGNRTPTVRIEASPASGPSPLTVTFRAVVEDEPGLDPPPPLRYSWNFGGGATSNAAAPPPVTFTGDGARTVTLTVVDDAGATASATTVVTVAPTGIGPPRNLRATNAGNEQGNRFIELAWDRVEGADRYEVLLRCESCDERASGTEAGTTLRIRGLSPGRKTYLAAVRARDARTGQWGPWSPEVRVSS